MNKSGRELRSAQRQQTQSMELKNKKLNSQSEFTLREHELFHILGYLPSNILSGLRRVAKSWNSVTTPILAKKEDFQATLNISKGPEYLQLLQNNPGFTAFVRQLENTVPRRAKILQNKIKYYEDILINISKLVGIKKLILNFQGSIEISTMTILQILQNASVETLVVEGMLGVSKTPKKLLLASQNISLKNHTFSLPKCTDNQKQYSKFWTIILKSSPNIHTVTPGFKEFYAALNKTGRISQQRICHIPFAESLPMFLSCRELAIEEIEFEKVSYQILPQVQELLEKQRDKLKILTIGGSDTKMHLNLPALRKLTLHHGDCDVNNIAINFAEGTPSLCTLWMYIPIIKSAPGIGQYEFYRQWKEFLSYEDNRGGPPCETLREIQLDNFRTEDPELLSYLGSAFPSVKKARWIWHDFPPKTLGNLGTLWQNLEELDIKFATCYCADLMIFGMSEEWKEGVDTTRECWWEEVDPSQNVQNSMASLTNLKKLRIHPCSWIIPLTDFSIYFGLCQMTSLVKFEIGSEVKFTPAGKEYLLKFLNDVSK